MEGFDKIRNVNLADLDEDHRLSDQVEGAGLSGGKEPVDHGSERVKEPEVKAKIDDPVGRHYVIDADITAKEILDFRLAHEYRRPSIILVNIIAVLFVIYSALRGVTGTGLILYIALAVFVIFYYPLALVIRSRGLKKNNKVFQQIFHYMLDEEGLHLQLEKEAIDVEWKYVTKMLVTKSAVIVYTGKVNAWIIPTKDMGDRKEEIIAFIREKAGIGKK